MTVDKQQVSISVAAKEDVPALVEVHLSVFGQDTLENRAKASEMLLEDIHSNSGLTIIKAETPPGNIVGYSMLFLPNTDAPSKSETIPTPLRPVDHQNGNTRYILNRFYWIGGEDREKKSIAVDQFGRLEIQKHVMGRSCANIQNMCVKPEFQCRSIGASMMAWACKKFDEENEDAYLEASGPGEKLYKKYGFRVIGYSAHDFGDGLKVAYSHMWRDAHSRLSD